VKKSRKRRKIELNLKKQTQFAGGWNERKYLYERAIWKILWFWAAKKQTQFKANQSQSYLAPRFIWGLKGDLKKQSQFWKIRIGVSIYKKGYYEEFHALRRRKNKPNSKPIKANLADPKGVEQRPADDGRSSIVPHSSAFQPHSWGACQLTGSRGSLIDLEHDFLKERRNVKKYINLGFFCWRRHSGYGTNR